MSRRHTAPPGYLADKQLLAVILAVILACDLHCQSYMEQSSNGSPSRNRISIFRRWYFWVGLSSLVLLFAIFAFAWFYYRSGKLNRYVATQIEAALQEYGCVLKSVALNLGAAFAPLPCGM